MTLGDIQTKAYALTGTNSTSYPAANQLVDLNIWNQKIVGMILDAQDEVDFDDQRATDYPTYTFPLVAGQRDYSIAQSYNFLKLKDLSLTYDGTNYYRATPIDSSELEVNAPAAATTQNATIDAEFSKQSPRYDYKWNALWIYPRATSAEVTAGAKGVVEFFRAPTDFTSAELTAGTVSPGFDITFHPMLAYGMAFEYAQSKQLPAAESFYRELQVYEDRLRKQYSSKQLDRKYRLGADYQSYK